MGDLTYDSRRRPDSSTQQRATTTAGKAVSGKPLQPLSHYDDCDGQSYHHDNNNNANGKVRLLISPAKDDQRGSIQQQQQQQQQQMAHSAATINSPKQQQQPQKQRSQPVTQSRQKNYHHHHHYDYYTTDSDLTSSILATQSNHYEENILLFATEHNNEANNADNNSRRVRQFAAEQQVSQKQEEKLANSNHSSARQRQQQVARSPQRNRAETPTHYGATGKFVNYYPSWRQNQSPATSHHQNYSFHVPLNLQQQYQFHQQQQLSNQQAGYGFVAPAERVSARTGGFKQSFRSSTIAHIPNLLKVSAPESGSSVNQSGSDYDFANNQQRNERLLMKSENDLLKVHLVPLNSHQEGYDNPFKPGTELSWEADMMVRLMKRGYPLQELPTLVQTAKQVAQVKQREQALAGKAAGGLAAKLTNSAQQVHHLPQEPPAQQQRQQRQNQLARRQSSNDLNSGKQVWADTLSRTKSLPRFAARSDNDSIDRLISSIEREMSDLLSPGEQEVRASDQVSESPKRSSAGQASTSPTKKGSSRARTKNAANAPTGAHLAGQQVVRKRPSASNSGSQTLSKKKQAKPCCRIQ